MVGLSPSRQCCEMRVYRLFTINFCLDNVPLIFTFDLTCFKNFAASASSSNRKPNFLLYVGSQPSALRTVVYIRTHFARKDVKKGLVKSVVEYIGYLMQPHESFDRVDEAKPHRLIKTLVVCTDSRAVSTEDQCPAQARIAPALWTCIEGHMIDSSRRRGEDLRVRWDRREHVALGVIREYRRRRW